MPATEIFEGPFGVAYSYYMELERLARPIARTIWGSDVRPLYESFAALSEVPEGGLVVDAPCGAGVAFRGLRPDQDIRYLALDASPAMLGRARRTAAARELEQVEFVRGDAAAVPAEDDSVDLFLSHFGLHCFADPRAAVAEIGRCVKPGGRVIGSAIVPSPGIRGRVLVRPNTGGFGPLARIEEIEQWLREAGFREPHIDPRGAFAYFSAQRS